MSYNYPKMKIYNDVHDAEASVPTGVRKFAAIWGVVGVMLLLLFAVYRLTPFVVELFYQQLTTIQVVTLVVWCVFMVYSEGYKAFGLEFAPRVVARAQYLSRQASWRRVILAPLFCVGYFGASKKRIMISTALFLGIVVLIVIVHFIPQPWRGIVDSGVVLGLVCGILLLVIDGYKAIRQHDYLIDPDVV